MNGCGRELAVPAHGEAHHLTRHAAFAKEQGVSQVVSARNGDLVRLAPGAPAVIGKVPFGRVFKDGDILVSENDGAVRERVKLAFAGVVSIALAVGKQGDLVGDPDIVFAGLPKLGKNNVDMGDVVDDAVFKTFDTLPRARRRDFDWWRRPSSARCAAPSIRVGARNPWCMCWWWAAERARGQGSNAPRETRRLVEPSRCSVGISRVASRLPIMRIESQIWAGSDPANAERYPSLLPSMLTDDQSWMEKAIRL